LISTKIVLDFIFSFSYSQIKICFLFPLQISLESNFILKVHLYRVHFVLIFCVDFKFDDGDASNMRTW